MKRYLNSVEEVLKALKEGKQVECDNDSCFELVDGWIVETRGDGTKTINSAIFFEVDGYKVYTEEPEPLEFIVNRVYKTRCGHKAFLNSKTANGMIFLCEGVIGNKLTINSNGKYSNNADNLLDIIGYWEEEK